MNKTNKYYRDPTADEAVSHVSKEEAERARLNELLRVIRYICRGAGYDMVGRIDLRDRKTGKVWR